ncbi:hypothetical protein, partial [Sulfobacillus harzensis]|uniref:hypothetical protein n=1 Tax=Sulfobacillus harzensis TaxID=2729629 RepID=UPI001A9BF19B
EGRVNGLLYMRSDGIADRLRTQAARPVRRHALRSHWLRTMSHGVADYCHFPLPRIARRLAWKDFG